VLAGLGRRVDRAGGVGRAGRGGAPRLGGPDHRGRVLGGVAARALRTAGLGAVLRPEQLADVGVGLAARAHRRRGLVDGGEPAAGQPVRGAALRPGRAARATGTRPAGLDGPRRRLLLAPGHLVVRGRHRTGAGTTGRLGRARPGGDGRVGDLGRAVGAGGRLAGTAGATLTALAALRAGPTGTALAGAARAGRRGLRPGTGPGQRPAGSPVRGIHARGRATLPAVARPGR
jgi:hypothetical protein